MVGKSQFAWKSVGLDFLQNNFILFIDVMFNFCFVI